MKNKLLLLSSFLLVLLASCKKDENRIYYEGGTAPVLTPSSTTPLVLTMDNKDKPAISFNWTNPSYQFTTGVSSQDVTYTLQVDTTGSNFSNPNKQEVIISKDLSTSLTVKDLNTILSKMNLQENVSHDVEFRIKSTLRNNSAPLYSNVVKVKVTPYLDVAVPLPVEGTLWAVGDATFGGWDNPLQGNYINSQKFTKVSNTLYELTMDMPGGTSSAGYKLIQKMGDWGSQYHALSGGTWEGGEFEQKDAEPKFPSPPSAGKYKITVNFKTGKYTVVKV